MDDSQIKTTAVKAANAIIDEVKKVIKGKDEIITKVLLCILSRGHILLEDIPGVGKTTLAMAFSKAMQLNYNRVQFTPDVMPSDVTGYSIYRKETGTFEFVKGAAICNLFLADEINRTSSKTQAALLQVMEEGKVTVDLKTYETPKPFTVIATQNPIGHAGTQLLPESQLDRFIMRLSMGYPNKSNELDILKSKEGTNPLDLVRAVVTANDIMTIQTIVDSVFIDDLMYIYMVDLVNKTRTNESIELGASPRGTICLANVSRAIAFLNGRDYVIPSDAQVAFLDVITHRIVLKAKAKVTNTTVRSILDDILKNTKAPQLKA